MAGIPITGLPTVPSVLPTDIFAIVQAGITSKATLAQVQTLFGFPGGVLSMANGGTGAALVPDNGAIVYSNATTMALLAHTTTANQVLLSGASGAPSWSGATYPLTTNINELLFSPAANQISGLATANNATLITSLTGVPSLSQILPSAVQTNITRLGAQAVDLNMNSHFIHNVTDPIQPQDASTKAYTDLVASGLNVLLAVYAASTANLNATYAPGVGGVGATLTNAGALAIFAIDGVTPPLNSRILVKNQTSTLQNGIYILSNIGSGVPWILTRATDYDQPSEITPGDLVIVNNGTANIQTSWVETATVATVGVDPILFSQFTTTASGVVSSGLINQLAWYAANGTTVSGLPTLASAGLLTNASGVPAWVASTGTGAPVLGTNPTISTPKINAINDQTNNLVVTTFSATAAAANSIGFIATASGSSPFVTFSGTDTNVGVNFQTKGNGSYFFSNGFGVGTGNYLSLNGVTGAINSFSMTSGATTVNPILAVIGSDTNITMTINGQGTGAVNIKGTGTNNNAPAGYVGEYITAQVPFASAIATAGSGANFNVTSISLTAGDWDVWGNIFWPIVGTGASLLKAWVGTTSATPIDASLTSFLQIVGLLPTSQIAPMQRFSFSTTTTVFLQGLISFTSGSPTACGFIAARRVR